MKKSNIFKDLFSSIFSMKDYARYAKEKTSRSIMYVLLLSLILSMILVYKPFIEMKNYFNFVSENNLFENIPSVTIKDDKLTTDSEEPYRISDGDKIFILDTSMNELKVREEFLFYDTGIILSKDYAYVSFSGILRAVPYELNLPINTFNLDQFDTSMLYDSLYVFFATPFIMMIPAFITLTISNFSFVLLISLMFSISVSRSLLKFSEIFKLIVHSCTLSLILQTLERTVFTPTFFSTFIIYILAYIYANNAIKLSIKEKVQS